MNNINHKITGPKNMKTYQNIKHKPHEL